MLKYIIHKNKKSFGPQQFLRLLKAPSPQKLKTTTLCGPIEMTNWFQIQYKLGSVGNSCMELVEKNLESMLWAMKTKKTRKFGVQATILPQNTL